MRMTEVGVFHKTKKECGNSKDVTWSLRAPVEGLPTTSSCADKHKCQTIMTSCFTKTFSIKHLKGETKVTAKYIKVSACSPLSTSVTKCAVKKIVYDCHQCEYEGRKFEKFGEKSTVDSLLRFLRIYGTFKATPPEATTLAEKPCIADTQLPADLKAGACRGPNLVTAVMKG